MLPSRRAVSLWLHAWQLLRVHGEGCDGRPCSLRRASPTYQKGNSRAYDAMMPARLALAVKDDNSRYLSTTSGCVRGRACIVGWVLAGLCSSRQHAETLRVGIESPNTALYLPFNCLSSIIVSAFAGFVTRRHLVMQYRRHYEYRRHMSQQRDGSRATPGRSVALLVYLQRDTSSHIVVSAGFGTIRAPAGRRPNSRWAGPGRAGRRTAAQDLPGWPVRYGTVKYPRR